MTDPKAPGEQKGKVVGSRSFITIKHVAKFVAGSTFFFAPFLYIGWTSWNPMSKNVDKDAGTTIFEIPIPRTTWILMIKKLNKDDATFVNPKPGSQGISATPDLDNKLATSDDKSTPTANQVAATNATAPKQKKGPHGHNSIETEHFEKVKNEMRKKQWLELVKAINKHHKHSNADRKKWKGRRNMSVIFTAISYFGKHLDSYKDFHPIFKHAAPMYTAIFRASVLLTLYTTSSWFAYNEATNGFNKLIADIKLFAITLPAMKENIYEAKLDPKFEAFNGERQAVLDRQNEDFMVVIKKRLADWPV